MGAQTKPAMCLIEDYQYLNQSNTPTIKWHHKVVLPNENPLNLWGILNLMFFLLECKNWSHISSNWWTWIKYTWLPSNSCSIWHLTCFQTFDLFKFFSNVWIVCTSCNTVKINSISQGYNKILTIIPRAQMGSDLIAHEAEGWKGYWLRGHDH